MAPIHGVIINWYGHIFGYVNFSIQGYLKKPIQI